MTNRSGRPKRKTGKLKMLLLTSSLIATLAGTQILSLQDALQATVTIADNNPITIVEPAADSTVILLPPTGRGTQLELEQIPQVLQPQIRPVARTRSSR